MMCWQTWQRCPGNPARTRPNASLNLCQSFQDQQPLRSRQSAALDVPACQPRLLAHLPPQLRCHLPGRHACCRAVLGHIQVGLCIAGRGEVWGQTTDPMWTSRRKRTLLRRHAAHPIRVPPGVQAPCAPQVQPLEVPMSQVPNGTTPMASPGSMHPSHPPTQPPTQPPTVQAHGLKVWVEAPEDRTGLLAGLGVPAGRQLCC